MTTELAESPASRATAPEPPPEPQHPHPPRYRRLKRYSLLTLLFLATVFGTRLWWGHEAAGRLAAEVDAIHARGEPVLPGDFAPVEVPEPQDAVRAYRRAMGYVSRASFQWDFDGTLPLTDADRRSLAKLLQANATAFQMARAARPLSHYATPGFRSPVVFTAGPSPNSRLLAQMLLWRSLYDHDAGDDEDAVESVRDVLRLALAVEHEAPTIIPDLVAGGLDRYATQMLSQVTHDLRVEGGPARAGAGVSSKTQPADRPASRAQVKALIAELLDDQALRTAAVHSAWGERMIVLDAGPTLEQSYSPPVRWVMRPALNLGIIRAVQNRTRLVAAAGEPDFPHARAKLQAENRADSTPTPARLEQAADLPRQVFGWTGESWLATHFERLALRRMAAVALAMRLYRADHNSAWPASLDELVPAYLSAIPVDPLAADGSPLRYVRDAPELKIPPAATADFEYTPSAPGTGPFIPGPIVYSVGRNGVDDGGSRQINPDFRRPTQSFSLEPSQWRDLVLPLAGNSQYHAPPPPPPLPDENDGGSTNAPAGPAGAPSDDAATRPASTSPSPLPRPASP